MTHFVMIPNKRPRSFITLLLCAAFVLPLLSGCGAPQQKVSKSGFYFDTIITITLYNTDNEGYIDQCFQLAKDYERKFSNTIETSEISQINANAGSYVEVSDDTLALIQEGIRYGQLSDGRFDITIGHLSDLWNFSEIAKNLPSDNKETDASVLPASEDIENALSHVDYSKIKIDGNRVKLTDKKAKLDLGGIAKGYIADQMRKYLNSEGISTGIINLGGNVLTLGAKENDKTYSIGIQEPFSTTGTSLGTLSVKDASVVSSGIYERYYRVDGHLYHHILDTKTGYPVENELYQVTIISPVSMDGDALSTTCFSLGSQEGMKLVESLDGVEAIFVTADGSLLYSSGIGDEITFTLNK